MKKTISYIAILLLITSCSDNTKTEDAQTETHENTWCHKLISEVQIVGKQVDIDTNNLSTKVTKDSLDSFNYSTILRYKDGFVDEVNVYLSFANDSVCKKKYTELVEYLDAEYAACAPTNTMASWELPSARDNVVRTILVDRSTFYNSPRLELKLKENDNRTYRR